MILPSLVPPASSVQPYILTFFMGCALLEKPTFLHLYHVEMKVGYTLDLMSIEGIRHNSLAHCVRCFPDPACCQG